MAKTTTKAPRPAPEAVYLLHYQVPHQITVVVGESRHTMHPRTTTGRRAYRPLRVDADTLAALRASTAAPYLLEAVAC